ncbi:hypothetical protein GCM10009827_020480 [Dactylosporangium maewongense]|uniref:Uncharacterized protein n=1 Tax=Dactylosporangium maewongense TaxID=634393 RepID=A0ABN1ZXD1_9ACTN
MTAGSAADDARTAFPEATRTAPATGGAPRSTVDAGSAGVNPAPRITAHNANANRRTPRRRRLAGATTYMTQTCPAKMKVATWERAP